MGTIEFKSTLTRDVLIFRLMTLLAQQQLHLKVKLFRTQLIHTVHSGQSFALKSMRLHVKHQTRLGGFASELRASLQDIYLNTEAGPIMPIQGIKTDKSGINRLHLVPYYGVLINISREYLWKEKKRSSFSPLQSTGAAISVTSNPWSIAEREIFSVNEWVHSSTNCRLHWEFVWQAFTLWRPNGKSQHPLHPTVTWHRHTSGVTHVCCAGRYRVPSSQLRLI